MLLICLHGLSFTLSLSPSLFCPFSLYMFFEVHIYCFSPALSISCLTLPPSLSSCPSLYIYFEVCIYSCVSISLYLHPYLCIYTCISVCLSLPLSRSLVADFVRLIMLPQNIEIAVRRIAVCDRVAGYRLR